MVPILIFPSIDELDNYIKAINHNNITTDYNNISVTGPFGEEEIELAVNGFHAIHVAGKDS
jgi:hypothetical protein